MSEKRNSLATPEEIEALEAVASVYDWPRLHDLVRRLKECLYQDQFEELLCDEFPDLEPLFTSDLTGK